MAMIENEPSDRYERVGKLATETTIDGPNICSRAPEVVLCPYCFALLHKDTADRHEAWHEEGMD